MKNRFLLWAIVLSFTAPVLAQEPLSLRCVLKGEKRSPLSAPTSFSDVAEVILSESSAEGLWIAVNGRTIEAVYREHPHNGSNSAYGRNSSSSDAWILLQGQEDGSSYGVRIDRATSNITIDNEVVAGDGIDWTAASGTCSTATAAEVKRAQQEPDESFRRTSLK